MRVRFLGTGTSIGIPVPLCTCAVCLSSDPRDRRLRPSIVIAWRGARVLVDTSPDLRQQVLLHAVERIDGRVLWANTHLLFWLSLVPVVTAWMGEHRAAPITVAAYGVVLLAAAIAYFLLTRALLALHAADSRLARALGADRKGKGSVLAYAAAVALAWPQRGLSLAIYVAVALVWLVPDRRIERALGMERRSRA